MTDRPTVVCRHWLGAEGRYCRSSDHVRYYVIGHRCTAHTPAALARRAEPGAGRAA